MLHNKSRTEMKQVQLFIRLKWILFILIPLLGAAALLLFELSSRLTLYPLSKFFHLYTFDDAVNQGKSSIRVCTDDGHAIHYQYTLENGYTFPYVGIGLESLDKTGLSIKDYKELIISIKSEKAEQVRLSLRFYIPGFSKLNDAVTYRLLIKEFPLTSTFRTYTFLLDEFITPDWWYASLNTTPEKTGPLDKEHFSAFELIHSSTTLLHNEDNIVMGSIYLKKDFTPIYISYLLICILYYLGLLVIRLSSKYRMEAFSPDAPNALDRDIKGLQHLEVGNYQDEQAGRITACILTNYSDADLSIEKVNQHTGVSVYKISGLLKKHLNVSFKQYLNQVRIEEAKHLLSSTDRTITEIALMVGYNNTTHFNRIFKQSAGISPKEYRHTNLKED